MDIKYKTLYTDAKDDCVFETAQNLRNEEETKVNKALQSKQSFEIEREMIENIVDYDLNDWNVNFFSKTPHYLVHFSAKLFQNGSYKQTYKIEWKNFETFIGDLFFYYTYNGNPFHNFMHANNGKSPYFSSQVNHL